MAIIPGSNLTGLPQITETDMKNNDPSRLNRTLRLLATQIQGVQTGKLSSTKITNATTNIFEQFTGGGGSSGGGSSTVVTGTITTQGTHAQRVSMFLAPGLPVGSYYYETDRDVLYLNYLTSGNVQVWQYVCGIYSAAYGLLPSDLGANDAGFIFNENSQFFRSWTWDGSEWFYSIGQPPYLAIQLGMTNTADPGWHKADGSTITVSNSVAGTTTVVAPNPYGYFLQGGTYTGAQVAAVKSTINPYTPAGSVASGFAGSGSFAGNQEIFTTASFSTISASQSALIGPVTYTPSGAVSVGGTVNSTFAGTPATLTVNAEGTPPTMLFSVFVKL